MKYTVSIVHFNWLESHAPHSSSTVALRTNIPQPQWRQQPGSHKKGEHRLVALNNLLRELSLFDLSGGYLVDLICNDAFL